MAWWRLLAGGNLGPLQGRAAQIFEIYGLMTRRALADIVQLLGEHKQHGRLANWFINGFPEELLIFAG